MPQDIIVLGISILIAVGILLHHPSKTLGLPSLLIFMGVGLAFGNGEFGFVYDDLQLTSLIGTLALNTIVFVGGLNTPMKNIRFAWKEGGMLSTMGVILTTIIFGFILNVLLDFNLITCMLFAAVVSSTDAAAVFSILESKKLKLKQGTGTILEFESATNDPIALLMVIMLTDYIINSANGTPTALSIISSLGQQIGVGAVIGIIMGKLSVWALNNIKLPEFGLIPVFILAAFAITVSSTEILGGNELIAVYIAGVIIGNYLKKGAEVSKHFFNGISWLAQSLMFIILGLQIFPQQLLPVFTLSLLPAILLIVVARPLAVQLCYLPFTQATWRKRLFVSMIGLKGATPIVFALIPAAAGVEGSREMIHMVFFIVLISVIVQGSAIEPLANKLRLNLKPKKPD
ncbi:potassium/proton antiporter [Shewanella basaltis]|jgi:cell volume regulation protein A|uniref:potassium/proton antiporter n=1 Tax=Shewanella basaltis TaxID=472183 RepID=UPI00200C0DF1|nr:potassium/proton antiporter [Shewanella basaltis]MCL1115453.1 potassium/proton antiporter [Shewanella basaltis]